MSRWRAVLRRELGRYRAQAGTDVVERQAFLEQARPVLRREFPENNHPDQKVSQVLQQLRDADEVEFVGLGTYRILTLDGPTAPVDAGAADTADADDWTADPDGPASDPTTDPFPDVPEYSAETYETTVGARSLPAAFRTALLDRYDHVCPVSGVDRDSLLDVAHVLPWSDHPDHRTDPGNVLALDKTHHAAFDAGLFTLDSSFRLRTAPDFRTDSDLLRRSLVERDGRRVSLPADAPLSPDLLDRHNDDLAWWPV